MLKCGNIEIELKDVTLLISALTSLIGVFSSFAILFITQKFNEKSKKREIFFNYKLDLYLNFVFPMISIIDRISTGDNIQEFEFETIKNSMKKSAFIIDEKILKKMNELLTMCALNKNFDKVKAESLYVEIVNYIRIEVGSSKKFHRKK